MMASQTPSASCPSCSDTPLAIATSTISFLTFLYALTVGLIYYYGLAKSSPEEIKRFVEALSRTFAELKEMVDQMSNEEPAAQQAEEEITLKLKTEIHALGIKVSQQQQSLFHLEQSVKPLYETVSYLGGVASVLPTTWTNWSWFCLKWVATLFQPTRLTRIRYLIIRKELQQKVIEKDRLMEDLRLLHQRYLKVKSDRTEKARWEENINMLNDIQAETAEVARLQDLHRKEQDGMQSKQLQMLESISRRITSLETGGGMTTRGETTTSDPPPESTE